jgi:ABC-type lipoprotein release transport system permease subunit
MGAALVVRGPASLQPRIERIVTSLNRSTAVHFESMDGLVSGTIARDRFQTALLTVFAACALLPALVGVFGALIATRVLQAMLYEVKANDPWTLHVVVAGFAAAVVACYLPVRRASRIDPSEASRTG